MVTLITGIIEFIFSEKGISIISDIFTIVASGIGIYLFVFKRKAITKALKVLLNYSYQITLSEIRVKLDRLNDLNVSNQNDLCDIINIFSEIVGQIKGNKRLKNECAEILDKLDFYAESPKKLSEPKKRSIISELRENLKNINVQNFDDLIGG